MTSALPQVNGWHLIGHLCELQNPGDYVCLPIAPGVEIAVVNTGDGLLAFDNRCPHRGARIYTGIHGNRPPVCGYHGRCVRADQVKRLPIGYVGGFLFVAVGVFCAPLPDIGRDVLGVEPALRPHSILTMHYACDWTVAVENALDHEHIDHVHIDHVHARSLATLQLTPERLSYGFGQGHSAHYFRSARVAHLGHIGHHMPYSLPIDYAHVHLFPYAAVSTTRGWTYSMQHYLPRADGTTDFISRLFVQAEAPLSMGYMFDSIAAQSRQVFAEDAVICAQVPAGHAGQLGPTDVRIAAFRERLAQEADA